MVSLTQVKSTSTIMLFILFFNMFTKAITKVVFLKRIQIMSFVLVKEDENEKSHFESKMF